MRRIDSPFLKACLAAALIFTAAPPSHAQNRAEIAQVKQAVAYIRKDQGDKALAIADTLQDPAARNLIVWLGLRSTPNDVGFDRAARFLRERGTSWPSSNLIRRRAERLLYEANRDTATVRSFFGQSTPLSGEGKFVLAKALAASGDQRNATALARMAWRDDDLSPASERDLLAAFPNVLTRQDHKLRADRMFAEDHTDAAVRAAQLAGPEQGAIALARAAVRKKS
jgi:soluble lytic murein transglycosylase